MLILPGTSGWQEQLFVNSGNVRHHRIIEMFLFFLVSPASVTGSLKDMTLVCAGAEGRDLRSISSIDSIYIIIFTSVICKLNY
ncbi:hypothetical protein DUA46_20455 [Salmonella enterica subsp. enterica]|nr:hypothetical protein [Salmonella enterica subsp. enterica serovar Muenchen]EBN2842474.1 hypothetical protein [Salmonella enterica]